MGSLFLFRNQNRNQCLIAYREDGKVQYKAMVKFVTEIVTGDCPECDCKTMLVNIYTNIYRCVKLWRRC